jgi:Uma2 family endonuclease
MPVVAGGDSLPEPDLAVFRAGEREFLQRHPRADESVLLVEISVSSLPVDRAKASICARAGAAEYWIVDVENRRLTVHQGAQSDGGYRLVRVLSEQDDITAPGTNESWRVSELLP